MAQRATNQGSAALAAALAFQRGTLELAADRMWAINGGSVALTPSLPMVYVANTVQLSGRVTYDEAVGVTEEHMHDLPYRQLTIEDAATARRLEPRFTGDGWTVDRDLVMALSRPPDREVDTAGVSECGERESSRLMAEWISEKPSIEPHEVDQVVEFTCREARARNARELGVLADDGGDGRDDQALLRRHDRAARGRVHDARVAWARVLPGADRPRNHARPGPTATSSCSSAPTTKAGPSSSTRSWASIRSAGSCDFTATSAEPRACGFYSQRRTRDL